jgi:hypothetical protein
LRQEVALAQAAIVVSRCAGRGVLSEPEQKQSGSIKKIIDTLLSLTIDRGYTWNL